MSLEGTWVLDPTHSSIGFSVRHAGIAKVKGKFNEFDASVSHDSNNGRVVAHAKTASFDTGNADRDNHVKSADFLDAENFPTLDFEGLYNGEELAGQLTIRGVSKPVVFKVDVFGEAKDPFGNSRLGAEATTVISRKDFGITWNAALETGGVLVSDKVTLELDLSFIKA